jgi:hypothetical protein
VVFKGSFFAIFLGPLLKVPTGFLGAASPETVSMKGLFPIWGGLPYNQSLKAIIASKLLEL